MGVKAVTTIVVLYILAAVAVSFCFWGRLHVENHPPSATLRNLVLIWGAPLATGLAVWRSIVAQKQAEIAQRSVLADRYQRTVEMLGHDLDSLRIGGIHALVDLAREQPAEGKVLRDGRIETIRHRAIVREDDESRVCKIELNEDPYGRFTEDGKEWDGSIVRRWRSTGWQPAGPFDEEVAHYKWLREQPGGWWGSANVALFSTYSDAQNWQNEHEIEGQPIRHRI